MEVPFRARLMALCAPVFWSITGIIVRLMEGADAWQVNVYRSGSLAVFLFVYLLLVHGRGFGALIEAIRQSGAGPVCRPALFF